MQTLKTRLHLVEPDLKRVLLKSHTIYPFIVAEALRELERQKKLVAEGFSETLNSKHLIQPDGFVHAVDLIPKHFYGWGDIKKNKIYSPKEISDISKERGSFYYLAGVIQSVARDMGVEIRWGGDWNGNLNFKDQTFDDLIHFEIVKLLL